MNFAAPPMFNAHSDPEGNGSFLMNEFTNALMHGYRINPRRQLQIIANCTRKVLIPDQVAIISFMPNAILWVTNNSQLEVGSSANDAEEIADALETRLPRDLSERVGHRIIRTAEQATLGIQCRTSFEMKAGDKNIKVGFDCYHEEPDFLTVVTLLTPISDDYSHSYDQAQLSSLRYLVGVITSGHDDMNILAATLESLEVSKDYEKYIRSIAPDYRAKSGYAQSTASTDIVTPADAFDTDEIEATHNPNTPHIYDFIPSMTFREIDYFYSMILGTAIGTYRRHESELQHSESVVEQEKHTIDPDDMDPNERMRSIQEQAISPVTQRRLRDPAEIRAELEEQKLRAQIPTPKESPPAPRGPGNLKNVGIKCLECGVDSSPEWRKGPNGPKTLCNRCGLRYAKSLKTQGR